MNQTARRYRGSDPTQRQLKVGEEIRHILSPVLLRGDIRHPFLAGVSITLTEARVSVDMRHAVLFVTPLGGRDLEPAVKALKEAAGQLRSELARKMRMKFIPQLHFEPDVSFDEAERINTLFNMPHVQQDLIDEESGSS